MKDKKSLYLLAMGTGLVATISLAVFSTSNTSLFKSLAGGIVHTSDKGRILTLDSSTPLEIDGTTGSLVVGNVGVYANNCEALDNGVVTMNGGGIFLYCATAGLNGDKYYGFGRATISSLSITLCNNNELGTLTISWVKFSTSHSFSSQVGKSTWIVPSSDTSQNRTFEGSSEQFISGQGQGSSCIYICYSLAVPVNIYNITVQYSCL